METRAHHVLIGFFTLLVAAAGLLFALWLGKSSHDTQFQTLDIVFLEAVSGLSKGSTVEFNGIKVGDVSSLRLDPDDPQRVIARVRVDSAAPVRSDTQARLMPAGVTGISIIRLSSGQDADSEVLVAGKEVPIIIASPSPFAKLLSGGEDVMLNLNSVLFQMRELLSTENLESVASTLRSLELASAAIAAEREQITGTIRQLGAASAQVERVLGETSQLVRQASGLVDRSGRMVTDEGGKVLRSAQRAMGSFEEAMQTLDALVLENRLPLARGMRSLNELGPALGELRDTLASLRGIIRQLETRPAEYLLGLEPMKEFAP